MRLSLSDAVHSSIIVEACAQAAHEANRAYCQAQGDPTQAPWELAPSWQRSSAVQGVQGVLKGNTPRENHASWMRQKTAEGWVYGPVKDPEKKEHPCMLHYDELPIEQQMKDHLFVGTVRAMAAALIGTPAMDFTDQPSIPPESIPPVDWDARAVVGEAVAPGVPNTERSPVSNQQKGYTVLSDEERAKGFVRPVRLSYVHDHCGAVTTMGQAIAETYARSPTFYGATFCCRCRDHFPVGADGEFTWSGTNEKVGT